MKVFIAGATGAVGRRAVNALVRAGHEVTGVARTDEKADFLRSLGATPVAVDLFDPDGLKAAVEGHEGVINLATHIPKATEAIRLKAWAENDRIRREASRNLVDVAIAAGAKRYIQESIAFLYEPGGDDWISEDTAVIDNRLFESTRVAEEQARRFTESGGEGVVLRFGMFYDAESHTTQDFVRTTAASGVLALPGSASNYFSFVATDDAGAAVPAALAVAPGLYNVVEDDPLTRGELADVFTQTLGRRVRPAPAATAKLGGKKTHYLATSLRVSNRRFREAGDWAPQVRSARDGLPPVIEAIMAGVSQRGLAGVLLAAGRARQSARVSRG